MPGDSGLDRSRPRRAREAGIADDIFIPLDEVAATATELLPAQRSAAPKPLLLPDQVSRWHARRHLETQGEVHPICLHTLRDAAVGPGGFILAQGRYVAADDLILPFQRSRLLHGPAVETGPHRDALAGHLPVRRHPRPVLALGTPGSAVYGHALLDMLPALWLFATTRAVHGLDLEAVDLLLSEATPAWIEPMIRQVLHRRPFRITRYRDRQEILVAPTIHRVSYLRSGPQLSPALAPFAEHLRGMALAGGPPGGPARLYVTRAGLGATGKRRVEEEAAIEALLFARGFAILDPARLPWLEQIRVFAGAGLVVGPFGSGMHNLLFAPAGTRSLVLGHARMNWLQSAISALRQQEMTYLFPEHATPGEGPQVMRYDTAALLRMVEALGG